MTAPRSIGIGRLPSGHLTIVDERGVEIPAGTRITTTGGDLALLLGTGTEIAIRDIAKVMAPAIWDSLQKAMDDSEAAGVKAGAQAGFDAGMKAGAKAGAIEGAKAGAQYVLKNSRVHRTVERDEQGRVTGSIEERVPE